MYYFYCPFCKKEDRVKSLPRGTIGNVRDGWGVPINHYECPNCHNLDAGYMWERDGNEAERRYYQHVINMYQNIRGFNKDLNMTEGDML